MIICPNLKNPDVAREFNELVQATSEQAAYHIWSLNNGNAIDKAPNGASSKLFQSLLDHYNGDRVKAIQAKAKTYSKSFLNWFGDWTSNAVNNATYEVYQGRKSEKQDNRRYNYWSRYENDAKTYGKNVRKVSINPEGFLFKREKRWKTNLNGERVFGWAWSEEYENVMKEFKEKTGYEHFDILENGKKGLQKQNKFFEFLESKGYKGYAEFNELELNEEHDNPYTVTFGNNGIIDNISKVVDENGEPLVVYHYTDKEDLTQFDPNFDNYFSQQKGGTKNAFFFTTKQEDGLLGRTNKLALYLNIKNLESKHGTKDELRASSEGFVPTVNRISELEDAGVVFTGFDDNKKLNQTVYVATRPNQIKSIDNQGRFSNIDNNIYDTYDNSEQKADPHDILEESINVESDFDVFIRDSITAYLEDNPEATDDEIHKAEEDAIIDFSTRQQEESFSIVSKQLADVYGLVQQKDGTWVSTNEDGSTKLVVQFVNSLQNPGEYLDCRLLATAHDVIRIGLTEADASTFNHEIAHHYLRMFWNSKPVQDALKAVYNKSMGDINTPEGRRNVEEALVDMMTEYSLNDQFLADLNNLPLRTKFWNSFNVMLYKTFNIKNNTVAETLAKQITKSFLINQKLENSLSRVDISKYEGILFQTKYAQRKVKDLAKYHVTNKNRSDQKLIERLVKVVQSKAKSFDLKQTATKFNSIYNDYEQKTRNTQLVYDIKANLRDIDRFRSMHDTASELHANIYMLQKFIASASLDTIYAINMMRNAKANRWKQIYFVQNNNSRQYQDDNGVQITSSVPNSEEGNFSFDELEYINEEVISYIKPIIENIDTVISESDKLGYSTDDIEALRDFIRTSNIHALLSDLQALYNEGNRTRIYDYVDSYIDLEENLDDELKTRIKINIHNWLNQQSSFGDIGSWETVIGIGQHSKSPLIRLMQNIINDMKNRVDDPVYNKKFELEGYFEKAKKAVRKKLGPAYIGLNFQKLLLQIDRDGKPTGKFTDRINKGQYLIDVQKYRDELLFGKNGLESKLRELKDDAGNPIFVDVNNKPSKLEIDQYGFPIVPQTEDAEKLVKEYLLKLEQFKCSKSNRQYTYAYYSLRINTLSLNTLRELSRITQQSNEIKSSVTTKGVFRIDRLSPAQKQELMRLNQERLFLGSIYNPDGSMKNPNSEQFKMAMELVKFHQLTSPYISYTTDQKSFDESRANSLDKDAFDREFTNIQISSELFNQLGKYDIDAIKQNPSFVQIANAIDNIRKLSHQRNILMSQFKGSNLGEIKWNELFDYSTGKLKKLGVWSRLKDLDEQISTERAILKALINGLPEGTNLPWLDGYTFNDLFMFCFIPMDTKHVWKDQQSRFDNMQAAISNAIQNDPAYLQNYAAAQANIESELMRLRYENKITNQLEPLEIFKTIVPRDQKFDRIPIQQFSKVDKEASNPAYVNMDYDQDNEDIEQPLESEYKDSRYNIIESIPELQEYLQKLKETMQESWDKIPYLQKYDGRVSQEGARTGQILGRTFYNRVGYNFFQKLGLSALQLLKNFKYWLHREFSVVENDMDYNPDNDRQVRPDGSVIKNIPIRFVKMLDDPEYVNSDLLGSTLRFYEMALNFEERSKNASKLIQMLSYTKNITNGETPNQTLKMQRMLDTQIYENLTQGIGDFKLDTSEEVRWNHFDWFRRSFDRFRRSIIANGKDWAKRIRKMRVMFQLGLLANNFTAGIVSSLDPLISITNDAITGKYINMRNLFNAAWWLVKDSPYGIASVSHVKVSSITHGLMQRFQLSKTNSESFRDFDKSPIYRFISDGLTMKHFAFGDYTLTALNMYATLDNWKQYTDSTGVKTFLPKNQFIKRYMNAEHVSYREALKKYKEADSARWAFKLDKNGKIIIADDYIDSMTEDVINKIKGQIRSRSSIYNGIIDRNERTFAQTNVWLQFLITVRNFMIVGIAEHFKNQRDFQVLDFDVNGNPTEEFISKEFSQKESQAKRRQQYFKGGYNFETQQIEDGIYSSIVSQIFRIGPYLKYMVKALTKPRSIGSRYSKEHEQYMRDNQLNEQTLYGTQKLFLNIAAAFTLFMLSGYTNRTADDDPDDYIKQVMNLITIRLFVERLTWLNPTTFLDIITSITPTTSDAKRKLRIFDLMMDLLGIGGHNLTDIEKTGNFKNRQRWQKDVANLLSTLGVYNWYVNMPSEVQIPFTDYKIPTFGGGAYTIRKKASYYKMFTPDAVGELLKKSKKEDDSEFGFGDADFGEADFGEADF